MIGQEEQTEKVSIQHPIVTGFYTAVGAALFAAVYGFVVAQFREDR